MTEQVTLILGEKRVKVPREDLISKSEYFASLFSPNFKDSQTSEHRINYEIDINTLKTFVKWISDHVVSVIGDHRRVKPSLAKYVKKSADFEDLLQLLQLSVLFVAEALIIDLTDLIACHHLIPEKSIQIWLLAKELGLSTLRDLAKVKCIERLPELPAPLLTTLSGDDFIELVGNIHIKPGHEVPSNLVQQWIQRNVPHGKTNALQSSYPFTLLEKPCFCSSELGEMYKNQQSKYHVQCIVGQKQTQDNEVKKCIYCWDGTTFSEITELSSSPIVAIDSIVGMKAVAQGFDIYFVGGEYGENSLNFQTEIWRYSIISKTWYYVTSIPRPRRHMAVTFVEADLYLIGGIERNAVRRSLVDVFNIHTGKWRKLPSIREVFTDTSLIFTQYDSVGLYKNDGDLYTYDTDENRWNCLCGYFRGIEMDADWNLKVDPPPSIDPLYVTTNGTHMYLVGYYEDDPTKTRKIFWVEDFEHFQSYLMKECLTTFDNQVGDGPFLTGFSHRDGKTCVESMKTFRDDSLETKIVYEENRSDIKDFCPKEPIGCFNVINPKSLNELFVFGDNAEQQLP